MYELKDVLEIEIGIAHINHGLREASNFEEIEIRKIAKARNVDLFVGRFTGKFTEQKARDFRYSFFEDIMLKNGYTAILTAHHQGDLVETFLMREITGRALQSLQSIQAVRPFANGELIRPLLQFKKSEFDAPLYFEDQTNHGLAYFRNRVRNQIIPELSNENPKFSDGIADLSTEIEMAMTVINEKIESCSLIGENDNKISISDFLKESDSLKYFILRTYFAKFPQIQLSRAKLQELIHVIKRPQQYRSELNRDYFFVKTATSFYVEEKDYIIASDNWQDFIEILEENPHDKSYQVIHIPEKGKIEIRRRMPHDEILIRGKHKKLRKFFIDEHISLEDRNNFLILVENNVYAIANLACSDLSKVAKNDRMGRTLWVRPVLREEK
ncbi:cell cycle protein mesJ [Lactococcus fujiensis JCM 16395]|uniref:tRNA(Ile)-lysidine synthase n=2 Tax=Lactococcus fujiensis TaxID=610251 RepID=A0A2A5RJ68_9LACT|nr:cell cycle protein mesJ [Lactococcus fujiensis JCM 16395]